MILTKDLKNEISEQLKTEELVVIPASEAEYLEVAYQIPYKIEYHESEIYTMGLASFYHETIVSNCIYLLKTLFKSGFFVQPSNSGVKIPKFEGGFYMPDTMVVKGQPEFIPNSNSIIRNPYIIIEVLSPATDKFDKESKLPEYKNLESLKQIIFINPRKVNITSYLRTENPKIWINQDYTELNESILIDNQPIMLSSFYENIPL